VIEEEPSIARIIEFKLAREGHRVSLFSNLVETCGHALAEPPDLVIVAGAQAVLRVRGQGGPDVLALVEHGDRASAEAARVAGAREVIEKPFKPTVLARTVSGMVGDRDHPTDFPHARR
jgi:DNA-binding response OmpR family regulator